jgi:serine/threonine protein kinase/Tol biopolymer transport system component
VTDNPNSDKWERIHEIFHAALDRPPGMRAAFVQEECAGDDSLRHEVDSLLSAHDNAGVFLESGLADIDIRKLTDQTRGNIAGRHVGPYELLGLIGRGGMGEVYRAKDSRLDRHVAMKFLFADSWQDERRLEYFEREARLASALNHPNIVAIYDIGPSEFGPFIAMELVDGTTLREILKGEPLPLKKLLQLAAQVADGLAAAHAAGIFHRDLKPENLMVSKDGFVKILDFGLAKLAQPPEQGLTTDKRDTLGSKPGMILGTVGYMSPEQATGAKVDFRSDQFSFGTILYEMVTGKPAFDRETAVETLSAIIRDDPEPITLSQPRIPSPLLWIINRCLAKTPAERYGSTTDLAADISNLRDHLGEISSGLTIPTHRARSPKPLLAVAGGLGILALVIASAITWLGNPIADPVRSTLLTFSNGHPTASRFTPDGQSVIYGAGWVGQQRELFTTQPGMPESRPLGIKNAGVWAVSATGDLAISYPCRMNWGDCMGTLAQVPLGSGEPREVSERVTTADFRPDGKTLVVGQFLQQRGRIVELPGEKVLYESSGWISDIRVSPDGTRVAFVDHPLLGEIGGSVCILESGYARVLSADWAVLQGLAWRPNNKEIWFSGSKEGRGLANKLFSISVSGGEPRSVMSAVGGLWIDDISRDGRRVLVRRVAPRGIIIAALAGTPSPRDLSLFDFSTVADLSADGKTLLFYEWGTGVNAKHLAYLRTTEASESRRLGEGKPLALSPTRQWALARQLTTPPQLVLLPTGTGQPRVLPSGSIAEFADWAAWLDSERIIFSASEQGRRLRTYIQNIDGGLPEPVTPEGIVGVLLSPDGRTIAAVDKYQQYYLYPIDGGDPHAIDGYLKDDVLLQWASDGESIFLHDSHDEKLTVYKLHLKTGERKLWKEFVPPYPAGLIGIGYDPGEIRITPDGQFYAYTFWTGVGEVYLMEGLR